MIKKRVVKETKPVMRQEVKKEVSNPATRMEEELLSTNCYKIEGTDPNNMVKTVYCPLTFVNGSMSYGLSPYDIVLRNIDGEIKKNIQYFVNANKGSIRGNLEMCNEIKSLVRNCISNSYGSSIMGLIDSYFEQYLVPKFIGAVDGDNGCLAGRDIASMERDIACDVSNSMYELTYNWWSVWDDNTDNEYKSNLSYSMLETAKNSIGCSISKGLSSLARQISFGELGTNTDEFIPEYIRDAILNNLDLDDGIDGKVNPQEFYWIQMSEYTMLIDGLLPLIDILLNQCYYTFNHFYFKSATVEDNPFDFDEF